jgi:inhibitor of KinA
VFPYQILPAGDSALVVQLPERIDPELNAWCIDLSRAIQRRLRPSVLDVVVGYSTVTVYFPPLRVDAAWLEDEIRALASGLAPVSAIAGSAIEVPVCYGGEFGPDLADVAQFAGCSEERVVEMHTARSYRVYLVGFVPGFAYLAEVDRRIAAPRRPAPRTSVLPGSVAIAGGQTGIYPAATPGGWNIIGRTAVKPFDPQRPEPFLFHPGDEVRFRAITPEEWRASNRSN